MVEDDDSKEMEKNKGKMVADDDSKELKKNKGKMVEDDDSKEMRKNKGKMVADDDAKELKQNKGKMVAEDDTKETKPMLTCALCFKILDTDSAAVLSQCLHRFCLGCVTGKILRDDWSCCLLCFAELGPQPLGEYRSESELEISETSSSSSSSSEDSASSSDSSEAPKQEDMKDVDPSVQAKKKHKINEHDWKCCPVCYNDFGPEPLEELRSDQTFDRLIRMIWGKQENVELESESSSSSSSDTSGSSSSSYDSSGNPEQEDAAVENGKPLIPSKAEEDDNKILMQPLVGNIGVNMEPTVFGASSSSPMDMKDVKPLTMVKSEDGTTPLMQTQTGESSVESERADEPVDDEPMVDEPMVDESMDDEPMDNEPMVDEPVLHSNGFEDQNHVPLSNEDTEEETSGGEEEDAPQQAADPVGNDAPQQEADPVGNDAPQQAADPVGNDAPQNALGDNNIPLWDTDAPLPQIPSRYLRIKDSNLPVSYVQKYVAMKLKLESEDEVELYLRNQPLDPSMLLCDLLAYWIATACPRRIVTNVGASGANYMLVLSYSRKPKPESP
ncbi:E3 ubiquitin protein ligase DRIP2-like [Eutrema salsugineum]|uniref:E3 ubiquitin protein ligase DRIP2-like n=1 Tax=Eutrema salsugineum TaxID=72664 RepID=UPI000CED46BA|nr:E3 ubiquitin protein ligase DRIP2-like [Eutrema salsugineum]